MPAVLEKHHQEVRTAAEATRWTQKQMLTALQAAVPAALRTRLLLTSRPYPV